MPFEALLLLAVLIQSPLAWGRPGDEPIPAEVHQEGGELPVTDGSRRINGQPNQTPANVDLSPYCSQKNQGGLGTCSAFALSCPVEYLENRSRPPGTRTPPYNVSSNWLVFLSVLDRLCDPAAGATQVNQGYRPSKNIDRMLSVGYCSEQTFPGYDGTQTQRGPGDVATPTKARAIYDELPKTVRGSIQKPEFAKRFKEAFGIEWQDAKDVFCPADTAGQADRLRTKKVSKEFSKCFEIAKTKARSLKAVCKPRHLEGPPAIRELQDLLDTPEPVIISMKDYAGTGGGEHSNHALSIVGYDKTKREFLVRNSWGPGRNQSIPYSKIDQIYRYSVLNCAKPGKANADLPKTALGEIIQGFNPGFKGITEKTWKAVPEESIDRLKTAVRQAEPTLRNQPIKLALYRSFADFISFKVYDANQNYLGIMEVSRGTHFGANEYTTHWVPAANRP